MVLFKSNYVQLTDIGECEFTFHYGPIQIKRICSMFDFDIHLHSTMVLFKSNFRDIISISNEFTFHYGPIQILRKKNIKNTSIIYIPLWSYSNSSVVINKEICNSIYIPLWSYSN